MILVALAKYNLVKEEILDVDKFNQTLLYQAIRYNQISIAKMLLELYSKYNLPLEDIMVKNIYGITALMITCFCGNLDIIKIMHYKYNFTQEDILMKDNVGQTSLYMACENNQYDVVKFLLEICNNLTKDDIFMKNIMMKDIMMKDKYGYSAYSKSNKSIRLLIDRTLFMNDINGMIQDISILIY